MARIEGDGGFAGGRVTGLPNPRPTPARQSAGDGWPVDQYERAPAPVERFTAPRPTSVSEPSAVGVPGASASTATPRVPVLSLDLHARLAVTGAYDSQGQGVLGLTQAQVEEFVRLGYQHAVIGLPTPWVDRYDEAVGAARQEAQLLAQNGIAVDAYRFLFWQKDGKPRSAEDVYKDVWDSLQVLDGQPVGTFWLDVEADRVYNPAIRDRSGDVDVEATQERVAAAHQAFVDWKAAQRAALENEEEALWRERASLSPAEYRTERAALAERRERLEAMQVGIYTSRAAWTELMGGTDAYARQGLPVWAARYPSVDYLPGDDLNAAFGSQMEAFGGWSVEDGTIVGWQWSDGRGERRQDFSETRFAVDRNVFYVDPSRLPGAEPEAPARHVRLPPGRPIPV